MTRPRLSIEVRLDAVEKAIEALADRSMLRKLQRDNKDLREQLDRTQNALYALVQGLPEVQAARRPKPDAKPALRVYEGGGQQ